MQGTEAECLVFLIRTYFNLLLEKLSHEMGNVEKSVIISLHLSARVLLCDLLFQGFSYCCTGPHWVVPGLHRPVKGLFTGSVITKQIQQRYTRNVSIL